ncbi:phage capsid family protein, partial [Streptococcus pyogenes]
WQSILTNTAPNSLQWRTFLQNAWNRASSFTGGKKHPLFTGEAGIWHNILVRKMDRAIRLNPGDSVQYCTQAGQSTAA